jgi:ATP:ADP antiporter, AAA family
MKEHLFSSISSNRLWRSIPVQPQERRGLLWSFGYFFFLMTSYYAMRPLRDAMGIAGGTRNLPWLFTATFLVLMLIQPVYGATVARLSRQRLIPFIYHFFVANLAVFWLLLHLHVGTVLVARVFFVWVGVFNLFVVSIFWSLMVDIYNSEQSNRLFGYIAAGGTAGALLGPALSIGLSVALGAANLLVVSAIFLELAVLCIYRLEGAESVEVMDEELHDLGHASGDQNRAIGGGSFEGVEQLLHSPYLLGIAIWVSLLSFSATFLYLQQADIVAAAAHNGSAQTRIFASIDLVVGLLSLVTQLLATGPLMVRFGIGAAAGFLPAIFAGGFLVLAAAPILPTIIVFQAVQRTAHFAISTPARQALFTVTTREEKYKVKNVIDLVVYRGSDALYSWLFVSLKTLGWSLGTIASLAVLISLLWLAVAIALGRTHDRRSSLQYSPALEGD